MAAHNRSSLGMEGRESMRNSRSLSLDGEDEYDLGAIGVSDGFQPTMEAPTDHNGTSSQILRSERRSTPPPRPFSTSKLKGPDGFALRHDGTMGSLSRPPETASAPNRGSIARPLSTSTEMPVMRAESPYDGPAGPSHPYQMYPQNVRLARTASVATSAFQPSERQYTGPVGPTHPYGMYPQNTISESGTVGDQIPVTSIPVGFSGGSDQYQRRLGPDGEESGDIIGPLGHTEQLPPYTQFPDEVFARKVGPAVPPGAGGIGLATRNPEFASREDLNWPGSRQSTRSITSDSDSNQINMSVLGPSEKPQEKKWKVVAGRKIWGMVPIWVFVLVGIIFVVFSIIIGGVFGAIIKQRRTDGPPPHVTTASSLPVVYSTVTTIFDATPIASLPTSIPPLPIGTFAVPLLSAYLDNQNCLNSPSLYGAWSCALPSSSTEVTVSPAQDSTSNLHNMKISISQANNDLSSYFYGSQPPSVEKDQVMTLVNDTSQASPGIAWFFQILYDKLVVVPESALPGPSNAKRDINWPPKGNPFTRMGVTQSGDKPWFCYWNGTLLEAFIYVNQSSHSGAKDAAEASSRSAAAAGHTTLSSTASGSQAYTTTMAPAAPTGGGPRPYPFLPCYPKQIKLEERRISSDTGSAKPYCVQKQILDNGMAIPLTNSSSLPIIIQLDETLPTNQPMLRKRSPTVDLSGQDFTLVERGDSASCRCAWFSS